MGAFCGRDQSVPFQNRSCGHAANPGAFALHTIQNSVDGPASICHSASIPLEVPLATFTTLKAGRGLLHARGNWSSRDDRTPSVIWLGVLWAGMIAGFGVDISRFLHENPAAPTVVRVHAFVFTAWMLILTAQVLLVVRDRVALHRRLGWFAAAWACVMAVLGPWAAIESLVVSAQSSSIDPAFLSVNLVDIAGFLALLAWGIKLRGNPAAHRRMMILATVSLADPGFSRFSSWLWPTEPHSTIVWFLDVFYGNVLMVVLMTAWDWWRGRMVRSFVIGASALLAAEFAASCLYFWGPWKAATGAFIETCARLHI